MSITKTQAVREVQFLIENGGINSRNLDYTQGILNQFGADADEVFQEAADQIAVLTAEGVVSEEMA